MAKQELTEDPELGDEALFQRQADEVYAELLSRAGEANPAPRLDATRRAVELLGDPHRAYPIIHVTGTNGKTSTSRITESILRAHDLRTGLLTSPHLKRINERIVIDGEPISNEAFVTNWRDIEPFLKMVDTELEQNGELPLTFFEAFAVLAFASFAEAPIDVAVLEVGMGGDWDATNVADGQVAVFAPISLDHVARLGSTITQIAQTKAGIIKQDAIVVSATQTAEAVAELQHAAARHNATVNLEGAQFELLRTTVAVGGQMISVRGRAATYEDLFLPMLGNHQAQNAAVAIAAVESFLGDGSQPIAADVLAEGLTTATSPGRMHLIGIDPSVIVDAAHNPAGAKTVAQTMGSFFTFDDLAIVLGVLDDKDANGIIETLSPLTSRFYVTASGSERAISPDDLAYLVRDVVGAEATYEYDSLNEAVEAARRWAAEAPNRAVLVTGSITLVGETMALASEQGWMR